MEMVYDCWSSKRLSLVRKILVSVKCLFAILGPEMGASILWTPGKMRSFGSFCRKTHVHKIPRFRGGGILGFGGGGGVPIYFYGRADFSDLGKILGTCARVALPTTVLELSRTLRTSQAPFKSKHSPPFTASLRWPSDSQSESQGDFQTKLNRGVSKPGCFPLFSGKVQIVSRTPFGTVPRRCS